MAKQKGQGRTAQASTEYLIILAVVVIVALAVVGVLGGFPTVSKGISEKDSATYWQSADIGIVRYFSNSTGTYGIVRNNKNFAISITSATALYNGFDGSSISLSPGESTTGFKMISNSTGAMCATAGTGSFTVAVSDLGFGYSDPTYGTIYNFTGLKPLIGSC
ncbi:MAG: hypothetical protein V1820_04740 [archaeon]